MCALAGSTVYLCDNLTRSVICLLACIQGYVGAPARLPIYVNGSFGRDFTFNAPNGSLPHECPACFTDLRFWGVRQ